MASISITVPDAAVPTLVLAARTWLASQGVDTDGMTDVVVVRRMIAGLLRAYYISHRVGVGEAAARATAVTEADGIL